MAPQLSQQWLVTGMGQLNVEASESGIEAVYFSTPDQRAQRPNLHTRLACEQLIAYFSQQLRVFELSLSAKGTAFQQSVWQALNQIPYGQTCSYQDIANQIGNPKAVRAVGAANGRNPIAIIVPCHRVIGKNGTLTGYAGGMDRKAKLLALEGL